MGTQPRLAQLNQPRPRPVIVPALLQPPTTALRLRRPTTHQPRPARPEAGQLGAIWSSAAPEFGARSVVDRFAQIEPKVLLAVDGYRYGGRDFDRTAALRGILAELPSVRHTVLLPYLSPEASAAGLPGGISWSELLEL